MTNPFTLYVYIYTQGRASRSKWAQSTHTLVGRWSLYEYIHARRCLSIVWTALRRLALRKRSRAFDPAGYTANCWAFACRQLRRAVSLMEMNCLSEYCLLPHRRGLIACSTLRQAAKRLAVDLVASFPAGGGELSNVFSPGSQRPQ